MRIPARRIPALQLIGIGVLAATLAYGESPQTPAVGIGGLTLGYLPVPGVGVQPILGIPGSSVIGAPLNLGLTPDSVWVSPQQDYALIRAGGAYSVAPLTGSLDNIALKPVSGLAASPDILAFSPTGASIAIFDKTANHVITLTGLPDNPAQARDADLSIVSAGKLTVLAISDDAGALIGGYTADDGTASIYLLNPGADTRPLLSLHHPGALAFTSKTHDAFVADDLDNKLIRIHDVAGPADTQQIAADSDGLAGPSAVIFSKDNNRAFVVNAKSSALILLDLTGNKAPITLTCPCSPAALYRLSGDSVFRLTEPGPAPLWLLDADVLTPQFVFVPPYRYPQSSSAPDVNP